MSLQACLQVFQLLSSEIAALVWDKEREAPMVQTILQALIEIILGKVVWSHVITGQIIGFFNTSCLIR